ncbi:MAG: hypothetical protein JWM76_1239 [Pseudonocardiales bacterium]|nr:hypothetical protein [Pseudonocardiales bacterium]
MDASGPSGTAQARLLARGTEGNRPAWLRPTEGERRWATFVCLAVAIALQMVLPARYALPTRYTVPAIEAVLLITLAWMHPDRLSRRSPALRRISLSLLALAAASVATSLGLLIDDILHGTGTKATDLLLGGAEIWISNVLIFALVYWEYDRGGPADRANAVAQMPDLLFPQMTDEHLAHDWEPTFFDYFYVSFTCASAFSPTDTMPLSRWCKALFSVEAVVALLTITLVAARAVNILPGGGN